MLGKETGGMQYDPQVQEDWALGAQVVEQGEFKQVCWRKRRVSWALKNRKGLWLS